MQKIKLGFAMCGSFCTINDALVQLKVLKEKGFDIIPIFSEIVSNCDTRFTKAKELRETVEEICSNKVISTIVEAEPIGPRKLLDVLVVCPCTGNTLAKLANGITDSSVTMAVKAHLRNNRPVILSIATNDALGGSAKNIGQLLNTKNIYFTPFKQDDPISKEKSVIADFSLLSDSINAALLGKQLSPVMI
jgi:dipicolinate synthase subunit B